MSELIVDPEDGQVAKIGLTVAAVAKHARLREPEPPERRTGSSVRRRSTLAGGETWTPITWRDAHRQIEAADRFEEQTRVPGKKNGALGYIGVRVYRLLTRMAERYGGRLDAQSIDWMAHTLKHTRRAIVCALARLKAHGFLSWIRRYVPTGNQGRRGPQVEQTTNAYFLALPAAAARLLGWRGKKGAGAGPEPVDHAEAAKRKAAELRAMADEEDRQNPVMARAMAKADRDRGLDPDTYVGKP